MPVSLIRLFELGIGVYLIGGTAWFYPHCIKPSLTWARARPIAFTLALVATSAGMVAGALAVVHALDRLPEAISRVGVVLGLLWAPAALSYIRPRWIVRVTGGPIDG